MSARVNRGGSCGRRIGFWFVRKSVLMRKWGSCGRRFGFWPVRRLLLAGEWGGLGRCVVVTGRGVVDPMRGAVDSRPCAIGAREMGVESRSCAIDSWPCAIDSRLRALECAGLWVDRLLARRAVIGRDGSFAVHVGEWARCVAGGVKSPRLRLGLGSLCALCATLRAQRPALRSAPFPAHR